MANNGNPLNPGETANFTISYSNRIPGGFNASKAATYAVTAQSFTTPDLYSGVAQYTDTSEVAGTIPEFPSVIYLLPLLTAISVAVIPAKETPVLDQSNRWPSLKSRQKNSMRRKFTGCLNPSFFRFFFRFFAARFLSARVLFGSYF
jgi:hypothetical protein